MASTPYFNPVNGQSYLTVPNAYAQVPMQMPMQMSMQPNPTPYMIQVDGEMAARAWQMPNNVAPGTVIPIWDVDGVHVYFKSVDAYGRLNPTRKARVVFEEERMPLPEGQSGSSQSAQTVDAGSYATRADFESLRNDIASIRQMLSGNRQNGRNSGNQGTAVRQEEMRTHE